MHAYVCVCSFFLFNLRTFARRTPARTSNTSYWMLMRPFVFLPSAVRGKPVRLFVDVCEVGRAAHFPHNNLFLCVCARSVLRALYSENDAHEAAMRPFLGNATNLILKYIIYRADNRTKHDDTIFLTLYAERWNDAHRNEWLRVINLMGFRSHADHFELID